jgi:predicted acetylornithine/succinylornithine family transaminase
MTPKAIIEEEQQYIIQTYKRFPIVLTHGEGVRVWDGEGKCYLDFLAGIAVNLLGYNHPVIRETITKQSTGLIHTSNLFYTENQVKLARMLAEHSELDKVFFCNSGAEANEAAIKLARKWGKGRYEIITAEQSFHGRTLAAITATGQPKYQKGFEPLVPGFKYVPFDDLEALKQAITPDTVAILLEAVQGEGGIRPASQDYLQGAATLCKERNLLLMFDEVQAGMGRTGKLFAYQHYEVIPDIVTVAKSLGGGFPIGALLAREEVAAAFEYGNHASTFGGGEFVTGIALACLELLLQENLLERVTTMGQLLLQHLCQLQTTYPALITQVRGLGLMAGIVFTDNVSAADVCQAAQHRGLLTAIAGGNVLRFVPPYIIQPADIEEAVGILDTVLAEIST